MYNKVEDINHCVKAIKSLTDRVERLKKELKGEMFDELAEPHPGDTVRRQYGEYEAVLLIKRTSEKIDRGILEQLIQEKGLWSECTREQIDESLVEQAFIEGKITDEELRAINPEGKPQLALTVRKIDVQGNNEGLG